jgi:shikimate kinase
MQRQIFLVGFMACGKTTVGPLLAEQLGRPFIDLDVLIEAQAGCTIFDLVRQQGEEPFRALEAETLLRVAQAEPAVIAPGGGAITRATNREVMRQYGVTLWLDTPFEVCWQRIVTDGATRPLAPNEATARERYAQRLPLYQASDLRLAIHSNDTPATTAASARGLFTHSLEIK